jgi:hypothetical protein
MALVKRRFFQFSLRGLLGLAAFACLALGGRHLLETYGTADGSQFSDGTVGSVVGNRVRRTWLCLYSIEAELDPVERPCQIIVHFDRNEYAGPEPGTPAWRLQEKIVDVK